MVIGYFNCQKLKHNDAVPNARTLTLIYPCSLFYKLYVYIHTQLRKIIQYGHNYKQNSQHYKHYQ